MKRYSQARLAAVLLAALATTGCASMNVSSYVERGANLRQYRTFAWGPRDALSTGDPRLDNNRFFDERVRSQVEARLASRGWEKTSSPTPDLLVHYHASVTQKIDVRDLDRGYSSCEGGDCRPYVYDAGTLFVDLVDARTSRLVWRGWAEGSINGVIENQDWLEERIDEAVERILLRLPPGL
jgi:hypothetical protein